MPVSPEPNGERARGTLFYGWVIVGAALVIAATLYGIRYSFGVYFTALEAAFGWNRAGTSTLYSVYLLLASLVASLGGWATDRYGPKLVAILMGTVTALGLFLTGLAQSMWQLYLAYSVLLALGTGASYSMLIATGSRWFTKNRATVLGIIGSGAGMGTLILAPVSAWVISAYDWRVAYMATAAAALVFVVPAALLLKKDPAEIGLQPDGGTARQAVKVTPARQSSMGAVLRTRDFWLIFVTWFGYSYCLHVVMAHVVPRAQDLGIGTVQAASIVSVVSAVSIPARIVSGRVSDRIDKRLAGAVFSLLHTAAMLWLLASTQMWMFYLFAVVYGIAYGGIDPPVAALIPDIFGLRRVGAILGMLVIGWGLGAATGPFLSGLIFDLTGSYVFAFLSAGLIMIPAAVCVRAVKATRQPGEKHDFRDSQKDLGAAT